MDLHHSSTIQRRPSQFGKLLLGEPNGAPEGARKHVQIPTDAMTETRFNLYERGGGGGGELRPYGFQREPGRSCSAMRKSMTSRRSSTAPSSKRARNRGPTSGSCSTRIGVMARSRGTAITTPAPGACQRARVEP
jgi:hypothetical protein